MLCLWSRECCMWVEVEVEDDVHVVKKLLCKNFMMSDGRSDQEVREKIAYGVLMKRRSV